MNVCEMLEEADKALDGVLVSSESVFKLAKARAILKDVYNKTVAQRLESESGD